jgi:RES domain
VLFRVFPLRPGAPAGEEGGALYVPRFKQGEGRHDNPDRYGALYASRTPESAVAEQLQHFRGQVVLNADLRRLDGSQYALATIDDGEIGPLTDLDDPAELLRLELRPSGVATNRRDTTRRIALRIFEEGSRGFEWWSTLEASWPNVTLFAERAAPHLRLEEDPEPLSVHHPAVWVAADALGIRLG